MSRVNEVDVRAGAVVVEGQGAGGADGQAGGGKVVEVGPKRCVKVKKVCAYSRLLSRYYFCSRGWSSPAAPRRAPFQVSSWCPLASVLGGHLLSQGGKLSIGTCGPCLGV